MGSPKHPNPGLVNLVFEHIKSFNKDFSAVFNVENSCFSFKGVEEIESVAGGSSKVNF